MRFLHFFKRYPVCAFTLVTALAVAATVPGNAQQQAPPLPGQAAPPPGPPSAPLSPQQLQQLVAPIALYPDSLVAQILAAANYPTQIVEAERFIEQNSGLTGEALANGVNQQDWAPSVKALTAFPSVLADMNQNLSWTSELGDANYNQPDEVMNAIQYMRQQAQQAGNLQNTPQESVNDADGDVEIQPNNPDVVYVPEYNPEYVYGYPVGLWPGFDPWWTVGGPYISFGMGIPVAPWVGFGWGWHHWGLGWGPRPGVRFGGGYWRPEAHAFYDRRAFDRGNYRGYSGRPGFGGVPRPGMPRRGFNAGAGMSHGSERRGYVRANPGRRSGESRGVGRGGGGSHARGGGFHGGGHSGAAGHGNVGHGGHR